MFLGLPPTGARPAGVGRHRGGGQLGSSSPYLCPQGRKYGVRADISWMPSVNLALGHASCTHTAHTP